jgi:S-formylglutathione hydrolase FrmB
VLLANWFFFTLLTLTFAPLALWAAVEVSRFRRRLRREPVLGGWLPVLLRGWAVVTAVLFGVLTTAVGLNRHYQYIPSFAAMAGNVSPDLVTGPAPRRSLATRAALHAVVPSGTPAASSSARGPTAHGAVVSVPIGGPLSAIKPRVTYVYLPPQYFDPARADTRFPVLYLLHGSPGISIDWLRGGHIDLAMDGLLARRAIKPFIVVLPDVNGGYGRDTECQDIPNGPQVQTYLTVDVVRYVDTHFRTIADRSARMIGGLSSGGYCALNLSLRHQDVYSGAVSESGFLSPERNGYTGNLFGGDRNALLANSPSAYLPTIPIRRPFGVYLEAGGRERASRAQSVLGARMLKARGVPTVLRIAPNGGHNFGAWRADLAYSLPWVSHWFDATHARTATPA